MVASGYHRRAHPLNLWGFCWARKPTIKDLARPIFRRHFPNRHGRVKVPQNGELVVSPSVVLYKPVVHPNIRDSHESLFKHLSSTGLHGKDHETKQIDFITSVASTWAGPH